MEAEHQGKTVRVAFDRVPLAIGRKANTEGFGLEEIGVVLTPQGTVEVNEYLQTSLPNVFACGDVAGPYQITHMASYQAWFAALNAIAGGIWRSRVNYSVVPWATFTDPEVARVGLSEDEAKQRGIAYELTRYEMNHHDRSLADGEAHGFVKILTVPGKDKILGVTIVGYHAGEQIAEFVFAMTHNMGLKSISAVTHIYPTLGEANKFAANAWRSARLPTQYLPMAQTILRLAPRLKASALRKAIKRQRENKPVNAISAICGIEKMPNKRKTTSAQLPSPLRRKFSISIKGSSPLCR